MSDKIEEIMARHSRRSKIDQYGCYRLDGFTYVGSLAQYQQDVDTLLAEDARHRAEIERLDLDLQRLSAMGSNNKWLLERLAEQRQENDRLRADRRERIATAALQGLLSEWGNPPQQAADVAIQYADALIAKLDKEEGKP